ncbi:MAG TPA: hypothetical protein VD996_15505, partial [Chitinophagaceae bacterium]|nr:hypothetical protein [Chitinophagaceae bacterium]
MNRSLLLIIILCNLALGASAQVKISGTVYEISRAAPLAGVSVISSAGHGTATDSLGRYTIVVDESDSLAFSFLNRSTVKFPVKAIPNIFQFDISLHVPVSELPAVRVMPRNYRMDSIQNRRDYAKAFDFRKPGIGISTSPSGGVGLDINQFINMFRFRYNRRMLGFQKRLLQEEEDKFIDQRFTRGVTRRVTGLAGDSLIQFMKLYRPSYEFTKFSTDYEFQEYIKLAAIEFRSGEARKEEF